VSKLLVFLELPKKTSKKVKNARKKTGDKNGRNSREENSLRICRR
jgi:hypothetical protein